MTATEPFPSIPRKRIAPGTHREEQQRLAIQETTHPACEPLNVQAVIWLFRAYNAALNAQAEELRPLGLSPSAFNVLMALLNTPGNSLEPCQLAERLLVSRPSITGLLDTLQAKALIRRAPDAGDRRRIHAVLTERARALLQGHFAQHYERQNCLLADLSPDETAQLVILLRRIRGAVPAHLETFPDCQPVAE